MAEVHGFFPLPFLPEVSCLPSLLVDWVILLTRTFSRKEVLWRSWVSPANLLWQIPFFSLWIQTSWRSIFKSHMKWHLEQCKNLKQALYKDPALRIYYTNPIINIMFVILLFVLLYEYKSNPAKVSFYFILFSSGADWIFWSSYWLWKLYKYTSYCILIAYSEIIIFNFKIPILVDLLCLIYCYLPKLMENVVAVKCSIMSIKSWLWSSTCHSTAEKVLLFGRCLVALYLS